MKYYEKTIAPLIEACYENFSSSEKNIADFFIKNQEKMDFSSKHISNLLYVSEASLSRFAKKCGFKGYREFIYRYKEAFEGNSQMLASQMRIVFDAYQELLNKSYNLVVESQFRRIVEHLNSKTRVFVYGRGSSGLAAREMQFRFMRLGLNISAVDDSDVMRMNSAILDDTSMVIGISISGKTDSVIDSLKQAYKNGAYTVLVTAYNRRDYQEFCNDVIYVAARKNLNFGNLISPQFPVLVVVDILYEYFQEKDPKMKKAFHGNTLVALNQTEEL